MSYYDFDPAHTNATGYVDSESTNDYVCYPNRATGPTEEIGSTNVYGDLNMYAVFDGADDRAQKAFYNTMTTNMQMGGWFYWYTNAASDHVAVSFGGGSSRGWGIDNSGGDAKIILTGIATIDTGWNWIPGQWYYLSVYRDASDNKWCWSTNGQPFVKINNAGSPSGAKSYCVIGSLYDAVYCSKVALDDVWYIEGTNLPIAVVSNHMWNTPPVRGLSFANTNGNIRAK